MAPAPTNLLLSGATVNERDLIGVPIGQLTAFGANGQSLATPGLNFSLVAGAGDNDNSRFRITAGGQLLANAVFDREVRSQLTVRIRVSDAAGQALEKSFSIAVNNLPDPIVSRPLSSAALTWGDSDRLVELAVFFDDPFTTGKVATFQLAPVQMAGNNQATLGSGRIRVLLYDQPGQGAPLTTANLEAYLSADRFSNTFIHRSVPGFVLQGGGFNLVSTAQGATVPPVSSFPAVRNEYSAGRSNLRGTISMAKLGSDPNSATSQWFWSLADNSANLDNQNGGFTVFGRLLGEADLRTLDAMADVPVGNASSSLGSTFSQLPLSNNTLTPNNLLRFSSITISKTGSVRADGTLLPGTGQRIAIEGLDRYALSLRNASGTNVDLDLGNGNHAFFLHDSWTPQSSALASKVDADGRRTAARFDQLRTIRMGECSAAGRSQHPEVQQWI